MFYIKGWSYDTKQLHQYNVLCIDLNSGYRPRVNAIHSTFYGVTITYYMYSRKHRRGQCIFTFSTFGINLIIACLHQLSIEPALTVSRQYFSILTARDFILHGKFSVSLRDWQIVFKRYEITINILKLLSFVSYS